MDELGNSHSVSFDEIRAAAREENWEFVDEYIQNYRNDDSVIEWALKFGVKSDDDNERDLAASVLEKTDHEISKEDQLVLSNMMENDQNPYAQYRAAFALFTHGNRSDRVINKIKEGTQDEDVAGIADGYLSQIKDK